jgi:excinuclease ABC subunit A
MSEFISVRGARTHNLKGISVEIPKNKLVVVTGVSGSGKSSLAFDTIYAEGQRRYLESLSTYARMIISSINDSTKVDEIRGLSPTIAIHQKTVSTNPRSTVGTITEIYDYYRLLFTVLGEQHCPNHPEVILKKDTVDSIEKSVIALAEESKIHILAGIAEPEGGLSYEYLHKYVLDKGFVRYQVGSRVVSIADPVPTDTLSVNKEAFIVLDRLVVQKTNEWKTRLRDSIASAYKAGYGRMGVFILGDAITNVYRESASCPKCDHELSDLTISHFSFNSHHGACESCHGLGTEVVFLEEKVMNFALTLGEGAILPWAAHPYYSKILEEVVKRHRIPLNIPYGDLSAAHKKIILEGTPGEYYEVSPDGKYSDPSQVYKSKYEGVIPTLTRRYRETEVGDPFMKRISQYVTEVTCPTCSGYRLKKQYLSIFIDGLHIGQLSDLCVTDARAFFSTLKFGTTDSKIAAPILKNINERLEFLDGVGLSYMSLSRRANTLSGGESQRIRLATQIGTRLEGIIYVLDEPSIGLHPRDNQMLIANMRRLVDIGNTVIVVEHDEEVMAAADHIIDIGPRAWVHGGSLVFSGTYNELLASTTSETGEYLSGKRSITRTLPAAEQSGEIVIKWAAENNLKNIDVSIPVGMMTVVTGVSGSGKSSLVMDILANATVRFFGNLAPEPGKYRTITGLDQLDKTIIIDQSPIGKTPHSNIATYTGLFTFVREVFASTLDAQRRGFEPGRFSFNTRWGRCEVCEGSGVKKIEMHFLPDVFAPCESCGGSRYNPETLEIRFKGKTIADVLAMTCEDALDFFGAFPRIARVLQVLVDVGLGYITLGQSAPTLSGGEAQRIKLAFDLSKRSTSKTLYILDEPTTGLHFSDVQKLLEILEKLTQKGNTVLIIEHNIDIIAAADHLIDIGPDGGDRGGELIGFGTPTEFAQHPTSHTAAALRKHLSRHKH